MPGPNPNSTRFIPQRKRDDVPFSYTPSEPFDLGAVPWHPHSQAPNELPAVPEAVKARNDTLLNGLQEEVRGEYEEREDLVKTLRWRGAVWAKQAVGDRLEQTATPIDEQLPKAFQFHHDPESMKLHWTRGSKADENALVRPTPSHLFVTPRPRAVPPLDAPPRATSSSTTRARMALDSPASTPNSPPACAPAMPALQEGTTSATPASASATSQGQAGGDDCLLTISIYSRPLLKPDRRTLLRTVAEKGYEERRKVEQERAASVARKDKRGRGQNGQHDRDDDDDADDDEEQPAESSSAGRTTISHRDTPLFAPQFGPTSSSADSSYTASSAYSLPRPTQVIELYASQTLQDLRDAFICRMDDLPERDAAAEQTGAGLRSTGKKRRGDAVMMIESLVVGQEKDSQLVEAMLKADTTKARRAAPPDVTMDAQRLDSLGVPVRLHTPYWFAHQDGACEHFWVIDQVRRPTAYDAPPPLSSSSNHTLTSTEQPTYRTPLTLYLSSSALSRPLPLYEQPCAGEHQYGMGRCKLCDRDQALFAVVGGAATAAAAVPGRGGGGDEGVAVGVGVEQGKGPPNLPEQVMALCKRCALLWSGRAPRSVTAATTSAITPQGQASHDGETSSSGSQPADPANSNGKSKRARITTSRARDRDRDRAGASRGRSGFGPGRGRGRGRGRGGGGGTTRERSSTLQPGDGIDHDLDEPLQPAAAANATSAPSSPLPLPRAPAPPSPGAISRQIAAKAELNADISGDATWRALCGVVECQAEDRRSSGAGAGAAVQPWSVVPLLD